MKIVHFHNGSGGGVLSCIKNIIKYKQDIEIENHVVFTLNERTHSNYQTAELEGAVTNKLFYYSSACNFYYTCRQLLKLLPDQECVIAAHDWLELGMVSNLGLQNPVVFFLHGDYDYYYDLAIKHQASIDRFVCVSKSIQETLITRLPFRKKDIYNLRLPVPDVKPSIRQKRLNKVIFVGRCEEGKGYFLLPAIASKMHKEGYDFEWNIVGEGSTDIERQLIWPKNINVQFYGLLSSDTLLQILSDNDFILLPSIAEGLPLTIIEAMKAGVIPVVNDLPGGLREIVENGETGFRIQNNSIYEFAETLKYLHLNRHVAEYISSQSMGMSNKLFNPQQNTAALEQVFLEAAAGKKSKSAYKVYGSRLDESWIPNIIVKLLRTF